MPPTINITLQQAVARYLDHVADRASVTKNRHHTRRAYSYALTKFLEIVHEKTQVDPATTLASTFEPEWADWFLDWLKDQPARQADGTVMQRRISPATEHLRLAALRGFCNYLSGVEGISIDVSRIDNIIRSRQRRVPEEETRFKTDDVEAIIAWAQKRVVAISRSRWEQQRALRDYAFLLLLADTGLRVTEACDLNMSDLPDPSDKLLKIYIRIKGGRKSQVRLSQRAWRALRAYLRHRQKSGESTDGLTAEQIPVFAQHSRLAEVRDQKTDAATSSKKRKMRRWMSSGAQAMLRAANADVFGAEAKSGKGERHRVTPHSFRHYFITKVLRKSGGNLKQAQVLARHKNIAVTQRYAHLESTELDQAYQSMFDTET